MLKNSFYLPAAVQLTALSRDFMKGCLKYMPEDRFTWDHIINKCYYISQYKPFEQLNQNQVLLPASNVVKFDQRLAHFELKKNEHPELVAK